MPVGPAAGEADDDLSSGDENEDANDALSLAVGLTPESVKAALELVFRRRERLLPAKIMICPSASTLLHRGNRIFRLKIGFFLRWSDFTAVAGMLGAGFCSPETGNCWAWENGPVEKYSTGCRPDLFFPRGPNYRAPWNRLKTAEKGNGRTLSKIATDIDGRIVQEAKTLLASNLTEEQTGRSLSALNLWRVIKKHTWQGRPEVQIYAECIQSEASAREVRGGYQGSMPFTPSLFFPCVINATSSRTIDHWSCFSCR
jgi:hypothetical protein